MEERVRRKGGARGGGTKREALIPSPGRKLFICRSTSICEWILSELLQRTEKQILLKTRAISNANMKNF